MIHFFQVRDYKIIALNYESPFDPVTREKLEWLMVPMAGVILL